MGFLTKWLRQIGVLVVIFTAVLLMMAAFVTRGGHEIRGTRLFANLVRIIDNAEDSLYGLRAYRLRKEVDTESTASTIKDPETVLVAIDDVSLKKISRWPWTRSLHGKTLDRLQELGAKTVAYDALFPEPEVSPRKPAPDEVFANAIRNFQATPGNKVILSYMLTKNEQDGFKEIPTPIYFNVVNTQGQGKIPNAYTYVSRYDFPIDTLLDAEAGIGFINTQEQVSHLSTGVLRFSPMVGDVGGSVPNNVQPVSLALASFLNLGNFTAQLLFAENNHTEILIEGNNSRYTLPLNSRGETRVRFVGGAESFPLVSIANLFHTKEELEIEFPGKTFYDENQLREILAGKTIFIGSTAIGAHDLRNTPIDAQLPGVYVHMNLFHMLKDKFFFKSFEDSFYFSLSFLLAGSIFLFIVMQVASPFFTLASLLGVIGIITAIDWFYLVPEGYNLKIITCFSTYILSYSWAQAIDFYREIQERKRIKGAFSRYVAPEVVKEVLANPEKLTLGGEKKEITMFFSDIRNFTNMSEKMTPQDLAKFLNMYMTRMTAEIFLTGGTLDKYIGDAIVAFWGAPLAMEDHAYQAVSSGLKMIEALPEINAKFEEQGLPTIDHGIGLNSGEVSVGNMGSDVIFAYTALGDHMNLAARVESLCKQYGARLMFTEYTYEKLGEKKSEFTTRLLDCVQVKGKSTGVKIIEALYSFHPMMENLDTLETYNQAYELYLKREFHAAKAKFAAVLKVLPFDKPAKRLYQSCEMLIENPPDADWSGVTVMTSK